MTVSLVQSVYYQLPLRLTINNLNRCKEYTCQRTISFYIQNLLQMDDIHYLADDVVMKKRQWLTQFYHYFESYKTIN